MDELSQVDYYLNRGPSFVLGLDLFHRDFLVEFSTDGVAALAEN